MKTTLPQSKKTVRKKVTTRDFRLEDVFALIVTEKIESAEFIYKLHPETQKPTDVIHRRQLAEKEHEIRYPLSSISPEELRMHRKNRVPLFVLKKDGKLYWTQIPKEYNLVSTSLLGQQHLCSCMNTVCSRLAPTTDREGGCAKVRNNSCCIERYKFILDGYETYNVTINAFVVAKCSHYKLPKKPKLTSK